MATSLRDLVSAGAAALSKDIMTIPEDEIPTTEVVYTILGGSVAYDASSGGH